MNQILKPKKGYKTITLSPKVLKFVIPEDWNFVKFNKLTKQITDGTHFTPKYKNEGIPFLRVTDIQTKNIDWKSVKKISIDEHKELIKRCKPEKGDILYSKNGTVGIPKIIDWDKEFSIFVSLCLIKPLSQKISTDYLYWTLLSKIIKIQMQLRSKQLSVQNLHLEEIRDFDIPLPMLLEQQKIASILSDIGNLITNTQRIIDQTILLKRGLMQKLLTKGIGHTKFKKIKWNYGKLLEIPETWDIVLLDTIAKRGSGHTPDIKNPEFYNGGIKWVSLADSSRLDNVYITETTKEISQKGIENSSAVKHPSGVVILSRDAGVGKSAITKTEMAVSQHFMVWECGEHLNNYFLYYLLQFWKPFFESIAIGTTIPTIGLPFFKKFKIVFPQKTEQDKIASILSNVDSQIQSQTEYKKKLERLKKSLMQKLLSGEVRVIA